MPDTLDAAWTQIADATCNLDNLYDDLSRGSRPTSAAALDEIDGIARELLAATSTLREQGQGS